MSRDSLISVDSGIAYTYYFPFKIFDYGGSLIEGSLSPLLTVPTLQNNGYSHLEIEHSATTGFNLMYSFIPDTGTVAFSAPSGGGIMTMSISGKVDYMDQNQGNAIKGAYGVSVVLLFHAFGSEPGACWFPLHPTFVHPLSGCTEHIHKCKVDVDGNFSFSLTVPTGGTWAAHYYDVELFVTNSNDAVFLTGNNGSNQSFVYTDELDGGGCGTLSTFRETFSKCFPLGGAGSSFSQSGVEIRLDKVTGPVLRNAQFSQDYYYDRGISYSVYPAQIPVLIWDIGDSYADHCNCDYFYGSSPTHIEYNAIPNHSATVDHEYGHYSSWTLWGNHYPDDGTLDEGWANFFQFAVRNYATAKHGDDLDWPTNCEEMPFATPRFGKTTPDIYYDVTSSFLWNLYDSYSDPNFKAPIYDNSDNDDVGEEALFFSTVPRNPVSPQTNSIQQFLVDMQASVGSTEAASMQDIYDCMFGPGGDGLSPTTQMRPAQLANITVEVLPGSPYETLIFGWNSQAYGAVAYQNPASGIHLYEDGTLIQTLLGTATSAFAYVTIGHVYDISTYNGSGDAYNPITASLKEAASLASNTNVTGQSVFNLESTNPNPFKDWFDVNFNLESGSVINYDVLSPLGVTLLSGQMNYDSPGEKHMHINSASLSSGSYVLRLYSTDNFGKRSYQTYKVSKIE